MSNNLVPVGGSLLPSRAERRVGRSLDQIRATQLVATAREASKLDFLADVSEMAMGNVGRITAVESLLAQQNPAASSRLAAVADIGCMAIAETVFRASRNIR